MIHLKIVSFASQNPARQTELASAVHTLSDGHATIVFAESAERAVQELADADVLLAHRFTPELLSAGRNLRWVHLTIAGVEKSLFPEFVDSEVTLTNSRGLHARPMAEWVMAALYYWSQDLATADRWRREREWKEPKKRMTERRRNLQGLKALVVGYGEVGRGIAALLHDNGITVEAVATKPRHDLCEVYPMELLEERLEEADIVVLALPATRATVGLFNRRLFPLFKDGSVLVNVARGSLLDEQDLLTALDNGKPAYALLDVFADEPLPADSPLFARDNVFMTPHVSGNFPEYTRQVHDIFAANLERYLNGEPLQSTVNKKRGY
ncbi:MAG: D-2-hydroxyacid dehydrogenase [bacterium]|nr:D-2-hydroxyacid dehydrogenase [bacterium]